MSDACHAEQMYPQYGGCGKKADGIYNSLVLTVILIVTLFFLNYNLKEIFC